MKNVDLIIKTGSVVTVNTEFEILPNHSLIVHNGCIKAILPNNQTQYVSENTVDRINHILMPGLINVHNHAAMSLLRGYADDLKLQTWLSDHIWPTENKWLSPEFVYTGTLLAIAEMLKSGTTFFVMHISSLRTVQKR